MGALSRIRSWIQTNITGTGESAHYASRVAKPSSVEEDLASIMEEAEQELIGPCLFTPDGEVSKRAINVWVEKLVNALWSLVAAGLGWLFWRLTSKELFNEEQEHARDVAEVVVPVALWLVCFLVLSVRRVWQGKKSK